MDFMVHLPRTAAGFDSIVVFVDRLTKRAHFEPTTTTATAADVAKLFIRTIFKQHGMPTTIVSDRDPKFVSAFWQSLFAQLGTTLAMSTAHHPQTDGQTERTNRVVLEMLRAFVNYSQDNWDDQLHLAEFAYNNATHSTTGFSPFFLDCGRHPTVPAAMIDSQWRTTSEVPSTQLTLTAWRSTLQAAKDAMRVAQEYQARGREGPATPDFPSFKVGDQVMLSTKNVIPDSERQRPSRKLSAKYVGPFKIIQRITAGAYKLELPASMKIHPVVNVENLKPFHDSPPHLRPSQPPPTPEVIDGVEEYAVEAILDKRKRGRGVQYLVKWAGYDNPTWERSANLKNAAELVADFESKHVTD